MDNQAENKIRENEIRNDLFNRTGLKIPINDPVIELIKAQEEFIKINLDAMTIKLNAVTDDIVSTISDRHNNFNTDIDTQISRLEGICERIEEVADNYKDKPKSEILLFKGFAGGMTVAVILILLVINFGI